MCCSGDLPQAEPFRVGLSNRDGIEESDDVARANLHAVRAVLDAGIGEVGTYNVGSGHPVSIGDVARLLAGAAGPAPVVTGEFRLGDVRHVVASPERARAGLGFSAEIGPEDGLPAFATAPLR